MGKHNGVPVDCLCGCGGTVISPDRWGSKHEWVKGHNHRGKSRNVGNKFAWKGDAAGYAAAHWRVKQARGLASEHECVDCEGPATDWSYVHPEGFSLDASDYTPRCRRCHLIYDKEN
jgi:hypothetical protein